jgi:hypothetical protein
MNWNEHRLKCHAIDIQGADDATLLRELTEFWGLFCRDVLVANKEVEWDCLVVALRGLDGGISIYPQRVATEPFVVEWCHVFVAWWERIIRTLPDSDDPADLTYDKAVKDYDQCMANTLIEAAQSANLTQIASRHDTGIRLRFHNDDYENPFLDVTLPAAAV